MQLAIRRRGLQVVVRHPAHTTRRRGLRPRAMVRPGSARPKGAVVLRARASMTLKAPLCFSRLCLWASGTMADLSGAAAAGEIRSLRAVTGGAQGEPFALVGLLHDDRLWLTLAAARESPSGHRATTRTIRPTAHRLGPASPIVAPRPGGVPGVVGAVRGGVSCHCPPAVLIRIVGVSAGSSVSARWV